MPSDDVPSGFEPVPAGPFLDHVGPLYAGSDADSGDAVLALRAGPQHLNQGGTVHGGLLATLVDTAMGAAVRAESDGETKTATVSLTTHYLGPGNEGDWIQARTRVERLGGKLAFVDCTLQVEDREIVRSRAVFALLS